MAASISRFKLPDTLDNVPNDIREAMLAVQEKAGFVPNVFFDVGSPTRRVFALFFLRITMR